MRDRFIIPLSILDASEDEIRDRTRVQKLCFIVQEELGFPQDYVFVPYDYGPTSKDLAADFRQLLDLNLIEREFREVENKRRVFYNITEEGRFQLERLRKNIPSSVSIHNPFSVTSGIGEQISWLKKNVDSSQKCIEEVL